MPPVLIGLLTLGAGVVSYVKQQEENDQAKAAAGLAIQQAKADAAVLAVNQDYGIVAAELKTKADALAAKRRIAELAVKRAQLEKNALLAIAVLGLLGAMMMMVRNRQRM